MTRSSGHTPKGKAATETSGTTRQSTSKHTARPAEGRDLSPDADRQAGKAGQAGDAYGSSQDEGNKPNAASTLVKMILERYTLGVTGDGEPYAVRPHHHVVRMLRGGRSSLRSEIAAAYYKGLGRTASQQALTDALTAVEGLAAATTPVDVNLRVAEHSGAVWVDLGGVDEHVVKLDKSGWSVVSTGVPIRFRRTVLTGTLPTPAKGGNLDDLWPFLNVRPDDRPVVLAWLVAALTCPEVPVPALALLGEQGTGKSSASRALVQLVDPSPAPLRKPPRGAEEWVNAAIGSRVIGLDNLSVIPEWLSDNLCRAVTGTADVRRTLYTDSGQVVFAFRRALVLNGIDLGALKGDLAERTVTVTLDRIDPKSRVTEAVMTRKWDACLPRLLGALLDLAAGVAGVIPICSLQESPRMADYALVLAGVDKVLGTRGLDRYYGQAATQASDTLAGNPLCVALVERVTHPFEGTAAELLREVTPVDSYEWRPPRGWPADPRAVTGVLTRNAPALRQAGWIVDDLGKDNKAKVTHWRLIPPLEMTRNDNPPNPPNPPRVRGSRPLGNRARRIRRRPEQSTKREH